MSQNETPTGWLITHRYDEDRYGYIIEGEACERGPLDRAFTFIRADARGYGISDGIGPLPAAMPACCGEHHIRRILILGGGPFYRCAGCQTEFVARPAYFGRWFRTDEDL